jgi:hypothetical protein
MNARERVPDPEWDRRKEDAELRTQTLKTLGAVQESIRLFERAINEHKVETENKIEGISDILDDHSRVLNGNADTDGLNQQLREMRRAINLLMSGVLGEGGNYDKSLKGQVESMTRQIGQVQAAQLKQELALSSLEGRKRDRIILRGQNLLVVAALCGVIGAVSAAAINKFGDSIKGAGVRLWASVSHRPISSLPGGWIKPEPVHKKKKARKVNPRPSLLSQEVPDPKPDPVPQPEADTSKPEPAPLNPY